jgi:hypothetical protein
MTCSVENCALPVRCKGLCGAHYQRARLGRPLTGAVTPKKRAPLAQRFWAKVQKTETCWLWTGMRDLQGYGYVGRGGRAGGNAAAYRVAYELVVGPIPDGLHIDHLCRNPPCVNPDHLEAVTQRENNRRAALAVTHCPQGHEYTPENTILRRAKHRACRICKAERDKARYWSRRSPNTRSPGSNYCKRGHDLTPSNTEYDPQGVRRCKTCRDAARRRYVEKRTAS